MASVYNRGRGNFNPQYDQNYYSERITNVPVISILIIILIMGLVVGLIIWGIWYNPKGISFGEFIILFMKSIIDLILWPIKFLFGIGEIVTDIDVSETPIIPTTHTEIIKHEITDCPPCTNECVCPTCKETDTRPYELEIKYLKNMVKLVGSIARRENAINTYYKDIYPDFSINSPHVKKLTHEYNFIKDEISKNTDQWQYFKNYFSRISGIPSTSQAIHYDLII